MREEAETPEMEAEEHSSAFLRKAARAKRRKVGRKSARGRRRGKRA